MHEKLATWKPRMARSHIGWSVTTSSHDEYTSTRLGAKT
jgi:hypothetical protein